MKLKIVFKDPDGVFESIRDAVNNEVGKIAGLDDDERAVIAEDRMAKTDDALGKWIKYSEYLTVEFDTDANTAVVLEAD